MSRRSIITAIVVLVLVGGIALFNYVLKPAMIKAAMSQMRPPPVTVTAEAARVEKWGERLSSIGTLIAYQGVEVASQVAGVITEIVLESGENVDEGGKVIQLDTAVEVADLASAKATLQEAEVAYQRQVELMQKRVTSEANLDAARAKRDTAYAAVNRIEAIIAQKSILAPFAGRLGIRKVNKGQYVSAGMALVSLQALDPIRVDFPMPEQQIGKLKVGQTVELTVGALPGKVFTGEIETLDARVAQDTRTLLVRGNAGQSHARTAAGDVCQRHGACRRCRRRHHGSAHGGDLQPLRQQRVRGERGTGQGGPDQKKQRSGQPAETPRIAERRFVTTGSERDDRVVVMSGLSAGEEVVTTGQLKINPGASIHVDNSQAPKPADQRPKL